MVLLRFLVQLRLCHPSILEEDRRSEHHPEQEKEVLDQADPLSHSECSESLEFAWNPLTRLGWTVSFGSLCMPRGYTKRPPLILQVTQTAVSASVSINALRGATFPCADSGW